MESRIFVTVKDNILTLEETGFKKITFPISDEESLKYFELENETAKLEFLYTKSKRRIIEYLQELIKKSLK